MDSLLDFDSYIQRSMTSWHCPGAAVAIVRGDEVVHRGAYGWRDVESQLPMTDATRFAMASVTKSITAMSVALLVDEGKLEWDTPVREYMPEFILADAYATQHVTVRDMLSHRTGLPRHDLSAWRLDVSRAEFIKRMKHLKFKLSFRESFEYNNLMYCAIAYLVEKLAAQPWEEFVHQRIFAPLGMRASNFDPQPPQAGQVNAKGYQVKRDGEGAAEGLRHMPFGDHTAVSPGAAGALFSTLADLTKWLQVHLNEGRSGDLQLVSPNNLKQMHLPQVVIPGGGPSETLLGNTVFTYGMGWFIEPYSGQTLVHHAGNLEGHSLIIGFVPQEQLGVVALTNIAQLPLSELLLYEGLDRALGLSGRDWNTRFHKMVDPLIAAEAKGRQTAAEERVEAAPPTHPWDTYSGCYSADGYPDFAVKIDGETLQASTPGSLAWSELRHYHYNVFEWHLACFDEWMKLRFLVNDHGEVHAVSIPMEPEVDDIVFHRKPVELQADIVAALVGVYESHVDGLGFTITAREGKYYFASTGGPAEEMTPTRCDDELVAFRTKRVRLAFVRTEGSITHLEIKAPSMTIEAPRKG